tara:strand:+ start:126 stop:404 length:279 start_codon:yes stop_codon:yes gene_type:complete
MNEFFFKEPIKFDYFNIKHYTFKNVKGTLQECEEAYRKEREKFPYFEFGTAVWERKKTDNVYEFLIGRFKTKYLLETHVNFPPTFIREGEVL